ncbi:MAG: TlpA family protein disulfide reductase [Bacteroidales bacterium]
MKKRILTSALLALSLLTNAQTSEIIVKGTVKFPDNRFKMQVYRQDGPLKVVIDSFEVNPDNTFEKKIKIDQPGVYNLDCQKWERLSFWGENENIEINFRGQDTAKMKIKNPPYHPMVNPGPSNELMNLINFFNYRAYQQMIASGREMYEASKTNSEEWKKYAADGYTRGYAVSDAYTQFLAENYANRNSAVALLGSLKSKPELHDQLLAAIEKNNPNYAPVVKYKKERAEAAAAAAKLEPGKVAPAFSFPTPDGKKKLGPKDFKGKYLLIDFWASWCGPCRKAIPHLKDVYEKYGNKGLEIFSVSVDKDDKAWKKAMAEENMPWPQVCAPNSGKEIMEEYQFRGIPHLVLLDKNGKIIVRNVTPDKVDEELSKLFK